MLDKGIFRDTLKYKDRGSAALVSKEVVDEYEKFVINKTEDTDCDDQHIIALLAVSRCPLFCSSDKRCYKYVKDKSFYPDGMPRVKIYSSSKNYDLLSRSYDVSDLKNIV